MNNFLFLLIPILFITFFQPAYADTDRNNSTKTSYLNSNSKAYQPDGLWLFLGTNTGIVDLNESSKTPSRDGYQFNLKAIASMYKPQNSLIYDFGLGFQSNRTSAQGQKVNTQSFFIDANARYEFTERWSIGPLVNLLVGNKNTFADQDKILATFLGATLHYQHPIDDLWILKVGGRVLTDIDVSSRRVNMWLLDFQIGFPPTKTGFSTANNESQPSYEFDDDGNFNDDDDDIFETDTDFNDFDNTQPVVSIKVDDVKYRLGKIQPSLRDEIYLKKLANILTKNQDLFEQVTVKGHAADFKSTAKTGNTNRIISHSRAKDVLKRLSTNGLPSSKIFSMAFGEYNPSLINPSKRRVELEFTGVTDENKLRQLIQTIR